MNMVIGTGFKNFIQVWDLLNVPEKSGIKFVHSPIFREPWIHNDLVNLIYTVAIFPMSLISCNFRTYLYSICVTLNASESHNPNVASEASG